MRRRIGWPTRVGALALVLLLASAAALWERRALAAWLITAGLGRAGLAPVALSVARIDLRGLELRDLEIGSQGELRIEAIALDYEPAALRAGRAGAARVRGLRLLGRLGSEGLSFGALDGLLGLAAGSSPAPGPAAARLALPLDSLALESAEVELETPRGVFAAALAARLARSGAALEASGSAELRIPPELAEGLALAGPAPRLEARLRVAGEAIEAEVGPVGLALGLGSDRGRLELELPRLALRGSLGAGGPLRATGEGGRLSLPELGIEASPLALEVSLDPAAPLRLGGARLALRALRDRSEPARFPPLELEVRASPGPAGLELALDLADRGRRLRLEARGSYAPATGAAQARLWLDPLEFAPGALQPGDLLPRLAGIARAVRGRVEALGRAGSGPGATAAGLEIALRDLSALTPIGSVEGLNAVVALDGIWPPSTPPGQVVSIARLDFGLPLSDGLVRFGLGSGGVLEVERAEWRFAGGAIRSAGSFDLGAPEQALVLEIEGLDLAQVLALLAFEGLSGEGTLDGRLPLERRGGELAVRGGALRARPEGGVLRYRPGAAGAGAAGASLGLLVTALDNFHFHTLELGLDGAVRGALETRLDLAGANPDLEGGRPVEFHLRVESQLADLLREARASAGVPPLVEEGLRGFSERARRAGAGRREGAGAGGLEERGSGR